MQVRAPVVSTVSEEVISLLFHIHLFLYACVPECAHFLDLFINEAGGQSLLPRRRAKCECSNSLAFRHGITSEFNISKRKAFAYFSILTSKNEPTEGFIRYYFMGLPLSTLCTLITKQEKAVGALPLRIQLTDHGRDT